MYKNNFLGTFFIVECCSSSSVRSAYKGYSESLFQFQFSLFCMGNLSFFSFEIQWQCSKLNSMKVFLINMLFFLSRILCLHIFILHIFSVTGQCWIFLIIWIYYLQQVTLTSWCMDITYKLCASIWVQVLHSLLWILSILINILILSTTIFTYSLT